MDKLAIGFVFACTAFGQQTERAFHLNAPQNLQDVVTTLKTVANLRDVAKDDASATITVKGTAADLALVDWLMPKLETNQSVQEHRLSDSDVVLIYPLAHTATTRGTQEVITTLRTVADLQRIYVINALSIIPLRGTPNQIALAKFIIQQFDQEPAPRKAASVQTMALTDKPLTAMVYGLAHIDTAVGIQELITTVRTVLSVQKIYNCTAPKMLAFVDTPEMVHTAEWLLSELDRAEPNTGVNEMRMPGGKDDVVHVFYLAHMTDRKEMNAAVMTLRNSAQIMFVNTNALPRAIIVRGTADQISLAGQLIAQKDVL